MSWLNGCYLIKFVRRKIRSLAEIFIRYNCKDIEKRDNKEYVICFFKKGCKFERSSVLKFDENFREIFRLFLWGF